MHTSGAEVSGFICVLIVQVTFIVVYGIFVRYDDALLPDTIDASGDELAAIERARAISYPRKWLFRSSIPAIRMLYITKRSIKSGSALKSYKIVRCNETPFTTAIRHPHIHFFVTSFPQLLIAERIAKITR